MRVLIVAGLLALPGGAWAQEAEPAPVEEIVVTATRTERDLIDVPAAITVQNVEQLRRDGFTYGTDEFRGVPGVSFRRGEGDGDYFPFVSIRGSTGTDGFLALIDGVPFVGIFEEPLLADVPYNALERVEVVRGPLSALYGRGALYGAVNYITRDQRKDRTTAAISIGSDDYRRIEGSLSRRISEGAGLLLGGTYENYEGWRENSRREVWSLYGKARFDIGARTELTAFGQYLDRFYEIPNGIPLDREGRVLGPREPFQGYGDPSDDVRGGIGSISLEHRATDALTLRATGQYRRYKRDAFLNFFDAFGFDPSRNVFGVNGFRNDTSQEVLFGEATAQLRLGRHNLIGGISVEHSDSSEYNLWSGQNGFTPACGFTFFLVEIDYRTGQIVNADHPCFVIDVPLTDSSIENDFFGAFVQDEWSLTDRLTLTVGGRYDSFRRKALFAEVSASRSGGDQRLKSDAFSPKAAISYRTGFGQVYASYGRGFNSNFGATFESDPNQFFRPELKPTTIDSYEVGLKGRAWDDRLRFEVAAYYTRQKNRRVSTPNPVAGTQPAAPPNLLTFGQLYDARGVEVSVDARPWDGARFEINYGYVDPEWKKFVLSTFSGPVDLSGKTPVGVARHTLYIAAEQRIAPWLSGRATFEHYGDYAITLNNRVEGGSYELLTLNARLEPESWQGVSLDLTLTNALDQEYYFFFGGRTNPSYATPGPPRQFRATLKANF